MEFVEQHAGLETTQFPWFALHVRSNFERRVALQLRQRGYEEFSPQYKEESQWSDRIKVVDRSLFPGYVFCRIDPSDRLPVLTVPGVVSLVGIGKSPTPVPNVEIERVRSVVESGLVVSPWAFVETGDAVLIERGPLAGMQGLVIRAKGKFRLIVSISLLQRSVSAEIDRLWVRRLGRSSANQNTSSQIASALSKSMC